MDGAQEGEAPRLLVRVEDRTAWVTLNRPERLNALDVATFRDLDALADELAARDDVGAVVLTGAGRAFSAGADLLSFGDDVDLSDPHAVRAQLRNVGRVVRKWVTLEKPTIAAVNGIAIGGGCNLALSCDLVLMREDATIGQVYAQRALILDMGGTYFLPRLVGRARAFELAYLGDTLSAEEAVRLGVANRSIPVGEFDRVVREWAGRLANGASRALGLIKTGLLAAPEIDLETTLEWEANAMALIFETADVKEAFAAFKEKRPPRYTGR